MVANRKDDGDNDDDNYDKYGDDDDNDEYDHVFIIIYIRILSHHKPQ